MSSKQTSGKGRSTQKSLGSSKSPKNKKKVRVVEVKLKDKSKSKRSKTATKKKAATGAKAASTSTRSKKKSTQAKKAKSTKASTKKTASSTTTAKKASSKTKAKKAKKPTSTAKKSSAEKKPMDAVVKGGKAQIKKRIQRASQKKQGTTSTKSKSTRMTPIPSPTVEVLKPFREAAKRNKKAIKERERASKRCTDFLAKPSRKGKKYTMDLRIHTPASLGFFTTGGVDPAPALIRLAKVKGVDMIGLTDYYSTTYVDSVRQYAESSKVTVLPGFDMRCCVEGCDEISAVALFPPTHTGEMIRDVMKQLKIPESAKGRPDYVIETDLATVLKTVESSDGVVIPSRIDKTPYHHLAIPTLVEKHGFHAFDLVHCENPEFFRERWPSGGFTFFSFSNANALGQIGNRVAKIRLANPGFQGLKELVARRKPEAVEASTK